MTTLAADGGAIPGAGPRITPLPFREALDWAKGRGVELPSVYYGELQGFARAMSFSIAGITQLDQLQSVRDSLAENLAKGETMREWQDKVRAGKIGLDLPDHRLECLLGDNLVSGAVIRAGHRRRYQGKIVEVVTNNSRKFTATPNHPMLTRRGWVAAGELNSRDDLIGYRRNKDHCSTGYEHKHERPSAISEVFVAIAKANITERVGGQCLDFHGDGTDSDVYVVRSAHDLPFGEFAAIRQPSIDLRFSESNLSALRFCPCCGHLIVISQRCGFCDRPYSDSRIAQLRKNEIIACTVGQRERVSAFSIGISRNQIRDRNIITEVGRQPTIDEMQSARISERPANTGSLYDPANPPDGCADDGGDFFDALPRDIEFDRVASLRVFDFEGHVYNLSTVHGYYLIDGLYTGNTVYRTNIQGSYARGRCEQQARAIKAFPWFMYDAINDSRTRPAHAAMDGFVARYDDPVWDTWTPPCGYNCRCRRIALSEKQAAHFQAADARRMEDPDNATARAAAQPDKGWDYSPCTDPEEGTRRAIEAKRATADHRLMESLDNAIWREAARAKTVAPALATTVTAASSVAEIVAWLNQLAELPQDEPEVIDATAQAEEWLSAAEAREAAKETA